MKTDTKLLLMKISALRHEKAQLVDAIAIAATLLRHAEDSFLASYDGHPVIDALKVLDDAIKFGAL